MRKIIYIIIVSVLYVVALSSKATIEFNQYAPPAEEIDSLNIVLYDFYEYFEFQVGNLRFVPLNFKTDNTIVTNFDTVDILRYRIHGDTLLFYERWCTQDTVDIDYWTEQFYKYSPDKKLYQVNSKFNRRSDSTLLQKYPGNISYFKIINYGDSLVSITENEIGFPGFRYISPTMAKIAKKSKSSELDFIDFNWTFQNISWKNGKYEVIDKVSVGNIVLKIKLQKDGVMFTIVNPEYYLKDWGLELYDRNNLNNLNGWMEQVEIGREYIFDLFRPSYPIETIIKFPKLQTNPNGVYVSKNSAYGYFFAIIQD